MTAPLFNLIMAFNHLGDGIGDDDWLHKNDLYVRPSVDRSKQRWEDTNGVFPTMSSADNYKNASHNI